MGRQGNQFSLPTTIGPASSKRGIGGNLIFSVEQKRFRDWLDESPDEALTALQFLWTQGEVALGDRVREFCELLPRSASSGVNVRTTLASVLLMGLGVQQCPPYRVSVFEKAYDLTDYNLPEPDTGEAGRYEHAMRFLDRFIGEAGIRGVQLRHRLDAQSVIWGILRGSEDEEDVPDWDNAAEDQQNTSRIKEPLPDPWSPDNIDRLAKDLLWEPDYLQAVIDDLKEKTAGNLLRPSGDRQDLCRKGNSQAVPTEWRKFRDSSVSPILFLRRFRPGVQAQAV